MKRVLAKLRCWFMRLPELVRVVVFWSVVAGFTWLDHAMGNDRAMLRRADPISGAILTSFLISAAVSAATAGAAYLAQRFLAPKPKPVDKGKLQGDLLAQFVGEGAFINEFYGGPQLDGVGGVKTAGIIIYMSKVRHKVEVAAASGGGRSGKGGGGAKPPDEKRHRYFCDIAIMLGRGELDVFQGKANTDIIYNAMPGTAQPTGLVDPDYVNPTPTFHPIFLPDPLDGDSRPITRYNGPIEVEPTTGVIDGTVAAGGYAGIRIYPGNKTQLPDPYLAGVTTAERGVGYPNAYRNRSYVFLENFEFTKWGSVPNFTWIVGHKTIKTLGAMYQARAARAGIETADMDFTLFDALEVRGYAITQRQAPRTEIELLDRVFDVDVVEDVDGVIKGVLPSDTPVATIPYEELEAREDEGDDNEPSKPLAIRVVDPPQVAKQLDVGFWDASNDFETANVQGRREVTVSRKFETLELPMSLTKPEGQRFADREIQKLWVEKDGASYSTFPKYAWIRPTDLVAVVEKDGSVTRVRVKGIDGGVPGALKMAGLTRNLLVAAPPLDADSVPPVDLGPLVPGNTVGTIMDIPRLLDQNDVAGFYAACCARDQTVGIWPAASLYWKRQTGWERLDSFTAQATMGRTVAGADGILAEPPVGWTPDGWDDTSTVDADYFFGEPGSLNDAQVLEGNNVLVVGNEVTAFGVATRIGGYPNRWRHSHLRRRLRETSSSGFYQAVESVAVGSLRSDVTAWTGMAFTTAGSPLVVTALGRQLAPGNQQPHELALVRASDGAVLARAEAKLAGGMTGKFKYVTLDSPVTLAAATQYYVVSSEQAGGDEWRDDAATIPTLGSIVTLNGSVSGAALDTLAAGTGGRAFGPVDFQYEQAVHLDKERVVVMNSAVRFIPADLRATNQEYEFCYATAGTMPEEADSFRYVWTARALRLPMPVDLEGHKLTNDVVATWNPGEIQNGLVEPIEQYLVSVHDATTDALVRSQVVRLADEVPIKWTYKLGGGDQSKVHVSPDGSISSDANLGVGPSYDGVFYDSQPFFGDLEIEFETDSRFIGAGIGVVEYPPSTPVNPTGVFIENWTSNTRFLIAEGATGLVVPQPVHGVIRLDVKNRKAEYWVNNRLMMRTFQAPLPEGLKVTAGLGYTNPNEQAMLRCRVRPYQPRQFVYTEQMQQADTGGILAPMVIKVQQIASNGTLSDAARIQV
jgi:hypothetical protein